MKSEIVERGGKLFIMDSWQVDFSKPIRYRLVWPTGLTAKDYSHFIGKKVIYYESGIYKLSNGVYISLEDGELTKFDERYTEEEMIKCPKSKREYHNGRWV
jgi:hypothetical protein